MTQLRDDDLGIDGKFNHLDSTPTDKKTVSSMTVEAVVENNPQLLKTIRSFVTMSMNISPLLPPESQIFLNALFSCFEKQKEVKEGILKDLVWGFEQTGICAKLSVTAIVQLEKQGYLRLQAPDNQFVSVGDKMEECWVRYQPKLLEMVYS